jgi:hypothetical protein
VSLLGEDLGSQVGHRPAEAARGVVVDALLGQSKVSEDAMALAIQHHVIRLQVPENNHVFVESLKGKDELTDVLPSLLFRDRSLFTNKLSKIASWVIIHDQEKLRARLKGEVKFDHEGVIDNAHYVSFGEGVPPKVFGHHLVLAEDLHSIELFEFIVFLMDEEDFSERALAEETVVDEVVRSYS